MSYRSGLLLTVGAAFMALASGTPAWADDFSAPGLWLAITGSDVSSPIYLYAGAGATSIDYKPTTNPGLAGFCTGGSSCAQRFEVIASMTDGAIPTLQLEVRGSYSSSGGSELLKVYVADVNSMNGYATPPAGGSAPLSGYVLSKTGTVQGSASSALMLHEGKVNAGDAFPFTGSNDLDVAGSIDSAPPTGPGSSGSGFNNPVDLTGGSQSAGGLVTLFNQPNTFIEELNISLNAATTAGSRTVNNSGKIDVFAQANVPEPASAFLLGTLLAGLAYAFRRRRCPVE